MTDSITIDIDDKGFQNYIEELFKKVKDLNPLMRIISQTMKLEVDENFETEGQNAGEKWADWSDPWRLRRTQLGRGSGKIMNFNGELRQSITRKATGTEAIVGTNKVYAAIHNFGGEIKKRNGGTFEMEKRAFMVWTDDLKSKIQTEVVAYLMKNKFL